MTVADADVEAAMAAPAATNLYKSFITSSRNEFDGSKDVRLKARQEWAGPDGLPTDCRFSSLFDTGAP
jgi:hypothetical protein